MKKILLSLSLFCCLCAIGLAQDKTQIANEKLAKFFEEKNIPGLSISIMQKGELVYSKGYGYADLAKEIPVDPAKTMFRIGSVSKTVTAAGLGRMYDQGLIDLDAPIQTYVPEWPNKVHDITLRQLAGHLAGIRHYKDLEFMSQKKYKSVAEGLDIFKEDPLINEPGTEYAYSSYGWNLIAAAMESAAKQAGTTKAQANFISIIQNEVFGPLQMTHTQADYADKDIPNRTSFYQMREGVPIEAPYVDNSYKWAGGGFIGTTEDLCKFGQAHMTSGYLSQETLDLWMKSQQTTDGKDTNYGIGWRTFDRSSGHTFYGHSGGSVGGITFFLIHIPSETTLAITANVDPLNYGGIQFELMELFVE